MEHRRHPRVKVTLPIYWGRSPECALPGKLTSLSAGGCFLQTERTLYPGDLLYVRMTLAPDADHVIRCNARYHMAGVGAGVVFQDLHAEDERQLLQLIEHYRAAQP